MSQDAPQPDPSQPQHLSARVPEHVSRGVYSSGVLVLTGGSEFVLDFLQTLGHPAQIVARVVIPHVMLPQIVEALRKNLSIYAERFGPPPEIPGQPPKPQQEQRKQSAQEVYDELKLPDDLLSGAYANGVMVGHSATEFRLDFLTNMLPRTAVSCRVFLAAPQVPRLLQTLATTQEQFQERLREQQRRQQDLGASGGLPPDAPN